MHEFQILRTVKHEVDAHALAFNYLRKWREREGCVGNKNSRSCIMFLKCRVHKHSTPVYLVHDHCFHQYIEKGLADAYL